MQDVIAVLVVTGEGDHRSEGDSQGVEILRGRIDPDVGVAQQLPLGSEEVLDSDVSAFQSESASQEDDDEQEGESGGEVAHFARRLNRLPDGKVDQDPGADETSDQFPAHSPGILEARRDLQHFVLEELFGGRARHFGAGEIRTV